MNQARVTVHISVSAGGMHDGLCRLADLQEVSIVPGVGNVKTASVARRTLIEDAERWFCELDGMVDGVHE